MFKKAAFGTVGLLLLISPVLVSADVISDLQAQVQALLAQIAQLQGQSSTSCVNLTSNMGPDDTDAETNGDVTRLQTFLASDSSIYPEGRITGYFGPATTRAVQRWQRAHGLVSSGDPDSTGYGFVGPRTRAAMAQGCGGRGPSATIDQDTLSTHSSMPTISGTATNVQDIEVSVGTSFTASLRVLNGRWSATSVVKLANGTYAVRVSDGITGDTLATGTLTVDADQNAIITVTAPNGGEQWEEGVTNTVTWTPYQYNPDVNPSKDVTAYLEQKGGEGSMFTVLGKVEENGRASIHWATGLLDAQSGSGNNYVPPGQYHIRVVNNATGASDRSDAAFTILPRSVDVKVSGSDGPITMDPSQKVWVTWSSTNKTSCTAFGVSDSQSTGTTQPKIENLPTSGWREVYVWFWDPSYGTSISVQCADASGNVASDWVQINLKPQSASLQITSPNGGEQFGKVREIPVSFTATGISSYSMAIYKNDQWLEWLWKDVPYPSPNTAGNLENLWLTGKLELNNPIYKIYITAKRSDGSGYVDDKSDSPFSFTTEGQTTFRSRPTVAQVRLPSTTLTNGLSQTLLRFSISAGSSGSVGVGQFYLNTGGGINPPQVSTLSAHAFTDPAFSNPVPSFVAGLLGRQDSSGRIAFSLPLEIPAGATYYISIDGNVSGVQSNSSLATVMYGAINNKGTWAPLSTFSSLAPYDAFIWSPNTNRTSIYSDADWTDGFDVGIPALGMQQTLTANGESRYELGTISTEQPSSRNVFPGETGIGFTRITLVNNGPTALHLDGLALDRGRDTGGSIVKAGLIGPRGVRTAMVDFDANGYAYVYTPIDLNNGQSITFDIVGDMAASFGQYAGWPVRLGVSGILHSYGTALTFTGNLPSGTKHVLAGSAVTFTATPTSGTAPLTVGFTGIATRPNFAADGQSRIDFGDGTSKNITNFADPPAGTSISALGPFAETHTYTTAGTFTATMTSAGGGTRTATITVTHAGPTAMLTANGVTDIVLGIKDPVTFAWSSTGGVSADSTYTVDSPLCGAIGTGPLPWTARTLQGSTVSTAGSPDCYGGHTFYVTYIVTDAQGRTASAKLIVRDGAVLSAAPASGAAPLTAGFSVNFNTCDANNYTVNYGDGVSVLLENIAPIPHETTNCSYVPLSWSHAYPVGGSYTAQLLVGSQSVSKASVKVTDKTNFSATPASGVAPLAVGFSATINTCDALYTVTYGDGTSVALDDIIPIPHSTTNCYDHTVNWQHTYNIGGTYAAKFIKGGTTVGMATVIATNVPATWPLPVASAPAPNKNANLANALTALEAALKSLLIKLR